MINKQNLWFITLFSLALILGIYYVSIDDEVKSVLKAEGKENTKEVIEISNTDALVALEVEKEEEKQTLLSEYQDVLLSGKSTTEEKNNAYESMQKINTNSNDELKIQKKIEELYKLKSFIKINDNNISIVIASNKHNTEIANNIIRSVQELFEDEKYITVKFDK